MEKTFAVIKGAMTPKGKVKAAVREKVKEQVNAGLFADFEPLADGSMILQVAESETGAPIYIRVKYTVTAEGSYNPTGPKADKTVEDEVEVPTLVI